MIYLGFAIIAGAVLALPAVALSLLCRNCKFFNLAYGDQMGLTAYLVLLFNVSMGLNFPASVVLSLIISAILGVIFYWVIDKCQDIGYPDVPQHRLPLMSVFVPIHRLPSELIWGMMDLFQTRQEGTRWKKKV
jgi:hypothetical protein